MSRRRQRKPGYESLTTHWQCGFLRLKLTKRRGIQLTQANEKMVKLGPSPIPESRESSIKPTPQSLVSAFG